MEKNMIIQTQYKYFSESHAPTSIFSHFGLCGGRGSNWRGEGWGGGGWNRKYTGRENLEQFGKIES
jgi:hypothetical protein